MVGRRAAVSELWLVAEFQFVEVTPFVDGEGDDPTEGEEADNEVAEGSEAGLARSGISESAVSRPSGARTGIPAAKIS